jgi:L-lactate dehydrogenase complex protein LldG
MSNPIIENVRKSLGHSNGNTLATRPAIYPSRQAGLANAEIELFLDEVRKLAGTTQRTSPQSVQAALETLVKEEGIRKAALWDTPYLRKLDVRGTLAGLGVELASPNAGKHEMADCDLGITEADYLLPETGTLVLRSSQEKPRGVSLLPRIHLAIVRPEQLLADLHQVFDLTRNGHYLVFITGPSRTADIELTITLGVHGPKKLFVWMLEGEI